MTTLELINFENEIADIYQTGAIKGPIHLRDGNEADLIQIFKYINPNDYKFATWANHLEALLSGVPREDVKARILEGRSMAMNFPQYRFYTSAIVGGICPVGLGVAQAIKNKRTLSTPDTVWMFIGDMTFHCGITHECIKYGIYNRLPIRWVVANNKKSVDTPTNEAWAKDLDNGSRGKINMNLVRYYNKLGRQFGNYHDIIHYYSYKSKFPHSGTGSFVSF